MATVRKVFEPLLRITEVMELLSVSRETVMRLITSGELPAMRLGPSRAYRVQPGAVRALVERRRVTPTPPVAQPRTFDRREAQEDARRFERGEYDHLVYPKGGRKRCHRKTAA